MISTKQQTAAKKSMYFEENICSVWSNITAICIVSKKVYKTRCFFKKNQWNHAKNSLKNVIFMHCNSFGILRKRWWCNKRSLSERHGIRQRLLSICDRDGWKILKLKSKVVLWFKDVKDGGIKEATSHAKKRSNKSAAAADGKSNVLRLVLWQGPKPGGMPNQLVEIRSGVGGGRGAGGRRWQ